MGALRGEKAARVPGRVWRYEKTSAAFSGEMVLGQWWAMTWEMGQRPRNAVTMEMTHRRSRWVRVVLPG